MWQDWPFVRYYLRLSRLLIAREIADSKKIHQAQENPKSQRTKKGAQAPVAPQSPKERRNHIEKKSNRHPTRDPGPEAPREQITLVLYTSEVTHIVLPPTSHLVCPILPFPPIFLFIPLFHSLFEVSILIKSLSR